MALLLKYEVGLAVILLVFGAFFATYHLTESPPVWYDEGFYLQSASNLALYGQMGLRLTPDYIEPPSKLTSVGYPLIYPMALEFKVFGVSTLSARALMVVFILGFLVASYFLARRLFGSTSALLTLALLVTLPPLYGNGKGVLGEVPALFYLVLFLNCFLVARSRDTNKYFWLIATGLFAGLCVATKPTFLLLLPAIAVGSFLEWRRGALTIKDFSIAAFAGLMPLVYWLFSQFQTSDSLSDILVEYANPYIAQNVSHIIVVNIARLFTDVGPLYLVGLMLIWTIAIVIRVRRRETISSEEVIALVFSFLTIAAYARTTGWFRYLFEAQMMSLIFFPNAFAILWKRVSGAALTCIPKLAARMPSARQAVLSLTVLLAVLGAYQVLFDSWVAGHYQSHKTAFLESYFRAASSTTFFFYNTPEIAFFSRTANYYQYLNPYELRGLPGEGWPIGKEQLTLIVRGEADPIVVKSSAYQNRKDTLFVRYEVGETVYEYSILRRKP